jgi:hypothetical protein
MQIAASPCAIGLCTAKLLECLPLRAGAGKKASRQVKVVR